MSQPVSLSRRERERLERRRAMLEAARAVFAEKGFEHARLDEIAERAEFGKGTLYNYFEGGKEEILFALLDDVHAAFAEHIEAFFAEEAGRSRSVREVLGDLLRQMLVGLHSHRDDLALLLKEAQRLMLHENPEAMRRTLALREQMVEPLVAPLERARAAGLLRDVPPRLAAHHLVGAIFGHLLYALSCEAVFGTGDPSACPVVGRAPLVWTDPEAAAATISTLLLDGLVARPDAPFPHA